MSNARLIWVLLKKNARRGYWNGGIVLITLGLAVSVLDWQCEVQTDDVWIAAIIGACIFSFTAGISSFSADFNRDNIYFLEYLPVRPWHIWVANCADGLLSFIGMIVALCWHRTLFFTPPLETHETLLGSRWTLLLVCTTMAGWFFASGVFYRVLFQRDIVPLVAGAIPASAMWLCALVLLYQIMNLFPSPTEIAPPIWLTGLAFLMASLFVFTRTPPHQLRPIQRIGLGASVTFAIFVLAMSYLLLAGLQWKELSYDEDLTVSPLRPWPDEPNKLLARVYSPRSFEHLVCIDLDASSYRDLGRGLEGWAHRSNEMTFVATRTQNSLFRWARRFVFIGPDGKRTELNFRFGTGQSVEQFAWSEDGEFLAFVEGGLSRRAQRGSLQLIVADAAGKIRIRPPISRFASSYNTPFRISQAHLLSVAPSPDEDKHYDPPDLPTYLLADLKSGRSDTFQLPGYALAFAPNLSRAVCIQSRVEGDRQSQSVVLADLGTKQESVLFSEDEIPVSIIDPQTRKYAEKPEWRRGLLNVPSFDAIGRNAVLPAMCFDDAFAKAVTISEKLEGELFTYTLLLVDLDTAEKKVLVRPEQMPKRHVSTPVSSHTVPQVYGFSRDGDTVLCYFANAVVSVQITTGDQRTLMRLGSLTETNCAQYVHFSPSRRRLYRDEICDQGKKHVLTVVEDGAPRTIYVSTANFGDCKWLDDDRIVFVERDKLWMIRADGTGLRQLFPPAR